jgi:hypothetical protein
LLQLGCRAAAAQLPMRCGRPPFGGHASVVALLVLGRAAVAPVLAFGRVQTSAVCVPAQPGGWRLEARGAAGGGSQMKHPPRAKPRSFSRTREHKPPLSPSGRTGSRGAGVERRQWSPTSRRGGRTPPGILLSCRPACAACGGAGRGAGLFNVLGPVPGVDVMAKRPQAPQGLLNVGGSFRTDGGAAFLRS